MVIVTLVAALAAAMVWRQQRAIAIEAAERARAQAGWVLAGALDWARLILREDARENRRNPVDHLGEVWAVPLAEARLSTFLAAQDGAADADAGPEAFLSGAIEDAQARFNLQALMAGEQMPAAELAALLRLADSAQLSRGLVESWATRLRQACKASPDADDAPLCPQRFEELGWVGADAAQREALARWVTLLPRPTPLNLNTAPREVIAAVLGIDLASAERLVQARRNTPLRDAAAVQALLPQLPQAQLTAERAGYSSQYFWVSGRLRLDERVVEQRSLVRKLDNLSVETLRKERVGTVTPAS
jgi:general secretion pathway protein K